MLIAERIKISDTVSLLVVAGLIGLAALLSLVIPPKSPPKDSSKGPPSDSPAS